MIVVLASHQLTQPFYYPRSQERGNSTRKLTEDWLSNSACSQNNQKNTHDMLSTLRPFLVAVRLNRKPYFCTKMAGDEARPAQQMDDESLGIGQGSTSAKELLGAGKVFAVQGWIDLKQALTFM